MTTGACPCGALTISAGAICAVAGTFIGAGGLTDTEVLTGAITTEWPYFCTVWTFFFLLSSSSSCS